MIYASPPHVTSRLMHQIRYYLVHVWPCECNILAYSMLCVISYCDDQLGVDVSTYSLGVENT